MTNDEIFHQWVHEHSDALYAYSYKRFADRDICKDLLQDTYLAAWRNMERYKGEASVKNWLFIILKSKITDYYRKTSTKPVLNSLLIEHSDSVFFDEQEHWRKGLYPKQWTVDTSNRIETKEFFSVFGSCSKKLKELQHTVFIMKYVDGMESEEICKILCLSSSNYWVLIHRAKVQLRACIEKNWLNK